MIYKRPAILDVIKYFHDYLLFVGLYPLLATMCKVNREGMYRIAAIGFLLFIPIVASYKLLEKVKNFALYVILGLAIVAAVSVLAYWCGSFCVQGKVVGFTVTVFASLIIFGVQIAAKDQYGGEKKDFVAGGGKLENFHYTVQDVPNILNTLSPAHWLWLLLLYFIGVLFCFEDYLRIMFWVVLLDVVLVLLHGYAGGLYDFVRKKQRIANLPIKSMTLIHRVVGVILGIVLLLFLLPSALFGREFLPNYENLPDVHIELEGASAEEYYAQQAQQDAMMEYMLATAQENDTPEWVYTAFKVVGYLLMFLCAVGLIRGIISIIREKSKNFGEEGIDEVLFIEPEEEANQKAEPSVWRKMTGQLTWQERIRRRYRKTIRKATKGKPRSSATPRELERDANLANSPELAQLHEDYERARYADLK